MKNDNGESMVLASETLPIITHPTKKELREIDEKMFGKNIPPVKFQNFSSENGNGIMPQTPVNEKYSIIIESETAMPYDCGWD